MPAVNDVGEPCAGEPHARFDGRELETERAGHGHEEERPDGKPDRHRGFVTYRHTTATAPAPDPTRGSVNTHSIDTEMPYL
jgi:hypothetical protein